MRAIRAILVLFVVVLIAVFAFGWWSGRVTDRRVVPEASGTPRGTSGTIDAAKARERGAEVGEKAAKAAAAVQETVAEAAVTSKIKAKMALDDHVQARSIDVTTTGSTVTLTGTVRSSDERERALAIARDTANVTRVIDRLVVQP